MATRKTSPKPTRSSKTAIKAKATKKTTPKSKSTTAKAKASTKAKSANRKAKPTVSKAKKTTTAKASTVKVAAKKVTAKTMTKATKKKRVAKSENREVVTIDRRRESRRDKEDTPINETVSKKTTKPIAKQEAAPTLERREKVNRRRQIDPTTCERDYSDLEVEFMNALDEYKRTSGRMFPTCSEVLEVIRDLGYAKLTPMELAARKSLEPADELDGDDLESRVEADANEALEESFELQTADEDSLELV